MKHQTFREWLTERDPQLAEASQAVGIDLGDEFDIASGDELAVLRQKFMKWAVLPDGPAKDAAKQQADDFAFDLQQQGYSPGVVNDIAMKAVQDGMGTFLKAATGGERAKNKGRRQADREASLYQQRASYRRSKYSAA